MERARTDLTFSQILMERRTARMGELAQNFGEIFDENGEHTYGNNIKFVS